MTTCGVCIEIISDSQQITCLKCKTNLHLNSAEGMMEDGSITKCARCKNVTMRKPSSQKSKSIKTTSSKQSSKSIRLELELLDKTHELEKRQLAEREELLKQKHDAERSFLQRQSLLLQQIEEKDDELSVLTGEDVDKVQSWIDAQELKSKHRLSENQTNNPLASTKNENLATSCVKPAVFSLSEESVAAKKVIEKDLPIFTGKPNEWLLLQCL